VDDDDNSRYLAELLLSQAGYLVDTAADGEEAWKALLSVTYDLLLTDHHMPRLCGLDLVARMRAAGIGLPVIINSGSPDLGEASNYPHLALAAVLRKAPNFDDICTVVKCILPFSHDDAVVRQGDPNRLHITPQLTH
jgi:CheY-like chemotaxis protein